jgi:hypothetical protein
MGVQQQRNVRHDPNNVCGSVVSVAKLLWRSVASAASILFSVVSAAQK